MGISSMERGACLMDMELLGETTAKLMDAIERNPRFEDGEITAIGIVCTLSANDDDGEPMSYTRTFCSDELHYRQIGLFRAGLDTVEEGQIPDTE